MTYSDDVTNSFAQLALDKGYAKGFKPADHKYPDNHVIYIYTPIITPEGEKYLREQKLFQKYPFIEKVTLVVISGTVSAITALLVNHFLN